tara:strand:+ start:407 stop:1375 length:969 start_codon:yes stop_codon:yes gene_type:complete
VNKIFELPDHLINPKYLLVLIIASFVACTNDENKYNLKDLELEFGVKASVSRIDDNSIFFENIEYGEKSRNKLDIHIPDLESPKGLLIFFHGGAFIGGDKSDIFEEYLTSIFLKIIKEDIIIVSANYSFLDSEGSKGVLTSLEDGKNVISFLEQNRKKLNLINKDIILSGVSAGAGISLWNGFRDNKFESISGILAIEAQSSYNVYTWEKVFKGFNIDEMRKLYLELNELYLNFYKGNPDGKLLELLDYSSMMDKMDPPFYISNRAGKDILNTNNEIDFDVLYHSFLHADYLRKKAIEANLKFSGIYQESPDEFVLRMLGVK